MTGKDIGVAIGIVILWSLNLIVQKIAVGQVSIFVLSFLRVAMVVPLIYFFPKPKKSFWLYSLCGFFLFGLYLILFNLGLRDVGAGITSFFTQLQVFFGILAFYVIIGEKPTWPQVIGIFISFCGVYLFSASSSPAEFPFLGVLFIIGSCISYGIGMAFSKKYKVGGTIEDLIWMALASSVPLLLTCFFFEGPAATFDSMVNISLVAFLCALFAAIVITLWTSSMFLSLLQRAPASSVMPFVLLVPIFSNVFSSLFLGESLSFQQMLAGIIILLGVMFAQNMHFGIPVIIYWVRNRNA